MLLKNKRKELKATISQPVNYPNDQNKLIAQHMKKFKSTIQQSFLSVEELAEAETEILRLSQLQDYDEEICALREGAQIKKKSQIYRLDPILQDDILRVGGRLNKAAMPQASHPLTYN